MPAAIAAALVLTACAQGPENQGPGNQPPGTQAPGSQSPGAGAQPGTNLIRDGYQGRFAVAATVLESPQHGPQLCIAVATSLPPQCGGPDIKGWKWDGLKAESAAGTTWGSYQLTGTFDGKTFTLTELAAAPGTGPVSDRPRPDFKPACDPKPATDPAKNSEQALSAAIRMAQEHPDFGGLWLSNTPPADAQASPGYDPAKQVLNVSFTKDLAAREADLRRSWGGLLCVTQAKRTETELRRIQSEITDGYSVAVNTMGGFVEVEVFAAYETRQRELDAKYGTGTVILYGALKPID
jgi:hypothetical protein